MMNPYKPRMGPHMFHCGVNSPRILYSFTTNTIPTVTDLIKLEETQSLKIATYMVVEHFDGALLALTTS